MASTYSTHLRIELIDNGSQAGTWGTTTNTNLGTLIEDAISGNATISVTASPRALTALNGAVDEARQSILTLTTTLTAAFTVLAPPVTKQYVVHNNTAYTATIGNATVINGTTPTGGTTVAIPAGRTVTMWSDGSNIFSSNTALNGTLGANTPAAASVTTLIASGTSALATSSGNLLVGTTSVSPAKLNVVYAGTYGVYIEGAAGASTSVIFFSGATNTGSISTTGSSVSYNTSSDYRLKEDLQPMTGATERVKALKPVNFAWKVDGSRTDGFLAHEAQEVVPEAVRGTKDAVDKDGKPDYQGIDQSKLVPLLTAALQEALTKIDSLTARIEALEGN